MKGLKASAAVVIITAITCAAIVSGGLKRAETTSLNSIEEGIVTGAGTFPGNMLCMYADKGGIYYRNYGETGKMSLYNMSGQSSSTFLTPIKSEHNINSFIKSGDYIVWKESRGDNEGDNYNRDNNDWELYLKKDTRIIKVDACSPPVSIPDNSYAQSGEFSCYGKYIVYSTYALSPDTGDTGIVVKLYDMDLEKMKEIFSVADINGKYISSPSVYKDHIVWGISESSGDNGEIAGDIYLYNIEDNSCTRIVQGGKLVKPMLWEDYIICSRVRDGASSIVLLNIKTGDSKDIAPTDKSISQSVETYEYSVGEGYAAWNNSSMNGVFVYDIKNDKTYELDSTSYSENIAENLINVKIYGKTVVYTNHRFKKDSGTTVSETGKYIVLR